MNRGSDWNIWDLHVHTPESFESSYRFIDKDEEIKFDSDIWQKYISEIEKLNCVKCLGITDYFSIEGYKRIKDSKSQGKLKNIELIVPNIEFRLNIFLNSRNSQTSRKINYHVIFSDELSTDLIEKEFLEQLKINDTDNSERPLRRSVIEEIGSQLRKDHEKFRDKTDYEIGCMNITIKLENIINILEKNSKFKGKYLLVLADERWNEIDWDGQDHLTRKLLFKASHAIFSANQGTIDFCLGKKHEEREKFLIEFGKFKPCIHGSDTHSFDSFCIPDLERYCWIKADLSFEGLKQIIFEPELRVKINNLIPRNSKNIYSINEFNINGNSINPELSLTSQKLLLNQDMICVIGGKGNGKTALIDLLATCFMDRTDNGDIDKNSFIQRIQKDNPDINVEIIFNSGDSFSKNIFEDEFFSSSTIQYLPQGKIEELSSSSSSLHCQIKQIIQNSKSVKEININERFNVEENNINLLLSKLKDFTDIIIKLEMETNEIEKEKINTQLKLLEGSLNNVESKIKDYSILFSQESENKVAVLKSQENELRISHSKLENIKLSSGQLKDKINIEVVNINSKIRSLNSQLMDSNIETKIPEIVIKDQIELLNSIYPKVEISINNTISQIEMKSKEIINLNEIEKLYALLISDKQKIQEEISTSIKILENINNKELELKNFIDEREITFKSMILSQLNLREIYNDQIKKFSTGKSIILSGIEFSSYLKLKRAIYIENFNAIFDGRKVIDDDVNGLANLYENLILNPPNIDIEIKNYLDKLFSMKNKIKGKILLDAYYNFIFNNYFELSTEVFFNNVKLEKLSIGQKGTILLKIFLAEGDTPLIIDQPEENLDNKFVYEDLVKAFKQAKLKRQLIIATHNANLVVNTDSEQIIIANFDQNVISYQSGSMENPEIRKEITSILEGGEEAFKRRDEKYQLI